MNEPSQAPGSIKANNASDHSIEHKPDKNNDQVHRIHSWWIFVKDSNHSGAVVAIATAISTGIVLVYTVFAMLQWLAIREQNEIAQKNLREVQAQDRPWLKVMDVALIPSGPNNPTLGFFDLHAPQRRQTATVRTEFRIRNIGRSTARDVRVFPELFFYPTDSDANIVTNEQRRVCAQAALRKSDLTAFAWSAVFPDDTFEAQIRTAGTVLDSVISKQDGVDLVRAALLACVTYQYPEKFQTWVAFHLTPKDSALLRVGRDLDIRELRFLRDPHAEHAQ